LSRAGTRATRLAWFVGLWLAGVLALAVVAWAIRSLILV
jgi:hypothetical protein